MSYLDRDPAGREVEHTRQYVEGIVRLHARAAGLDLDRIRASRQAIIIRASAQRLEVPRQVAELVRELSPKSLGVRGIELSHYPDSAQHLGNGSGNQAYRTDLTLAAQLPMPPVPEDMREIFAYNQSLPWNQRILPAEAPPMDRIMFDPNVSPMTCGVLASGVSVVPLTGQIEFEQRDRRVVGPGLVVSVAEALARFQSHSPYERKTVAVL